jgi:hypothetical protein
VVVVVVVADHDDLAGGGEKGSRPPRKRKDHGDTQLPGCLLLGDQRRRCVENLQAGAVDGDNRPVAEWVLCCIASALSDGANSA